MIRSSTSAGRGIRIACGGLISFFLCIVLGAPTEPVTAQTSAPWPLALHDHQNTGRSQFLGPNSDNVLWRRGFEGYELGPRVVVGEGGVIYVPASTTDNDAALLAVNLDGSLRWASNLGVRSAFRKTRLAIGPTGVVYVLDVDFAVRTLTAVNTEGSILWQLDPGTGDTTPNLTVGAEGTIYVDSPGRGSCLGTGWLIAFRPEDGTEKWRTQTGCGGPNSPPAVGPDGTIYVAATPGVVAVRPEDGTLKWPSGVDIGDLGVSQSVGPDGAIYVVSTGTTGLGASVAYLTAASPSGDVLWVFDLRNFPDYLSSCGVSDAIDIGMGRPLITANGAIIVSAFARSSAASAWAFLVFDSDPITPSVICVPQATIIGEYVIDAAGSVFADVSTEPSGAVREFAEVSPLGVIRWTFRESILGNPAIGQDGAIHLLTSRDLVTLGPGGGLPVDTDSDGILDQNDACPNDADDFLRPGESAGPPASGDGCPESVLDSDGDGVPNAEDACPGTPAGAPPDANGCSQTQVDPDLDGVCTAGTTSNQWCRGSDSCSGTDSGSAVDGGGCSQTQVDPDLDGVCTLGKTSDRWCKGADSCPGTAGGAQVDMTGCSQSQVDGDSDGVCDPGKSSDVWCSGFDICPGTLPVEFPDHDGCSRAQRKELDGINRKYGDLIQKIRNEDFLGLAFSDCTDLELGQLLGNEATRRFIEASIRRIEFGRRVLDPGVSSASERELLTYLARQVVVDALLEVLRIAGNPLVPIVGSFLTLADGAEVFLKLASALSDLPKRQLVLFYFGERRSGMSQEDAFRDIIAHDDFKPIVDLVLHLTRQDMEQFGVYLEEAYQSFELAENSAKRQIISDFLIDRCNDLRASTLAAQDMH